MDGIADEDGRTPGGAPGAPRPRRRPAPPRRRSESIAPAEQASVDEAVVEDAVVQDAAVQEASIREASVPPAAEASSRPARKRAATKSAASRPRRKSVADKDRSSEAAADQDLSSPAAADQDPSSKATGDASTSSPAAAKKHTSSRAASKAARSSSEAAPTEPGAEPSPAITLTSVPSTGPRIRTTPRVRRHAPVRVPTAKVALSTASVYPESVAAAFEIARRLGYDGIELLVFTDPVSQDPDAVRSLSDYYGVPVLSVHSPCLLVTQRVWSTDPWEKLRRSQAAAERFGCRTVVVHPPFRWQRDYGRDFEVGLQRMRDETDVVFAVENMYPWRAASREWAAYLPDWDPRNQDYPHVTLDLSHTAVSGTDALVMAADFGDRLAHIHLADGTGLARDEHLIPGRGNQPCAELLEGLAAQGFSGTIVLEVSTRRAANRAEREAELAEALAFARLHLAAPLESPAP